RLQVVLPCLSVADLQERHRADVHTLPRQVRVALVIPRERDAPLAVFPLLVCSRCARTYERPRLRVGTGGGGRPVGQLEELVPRVHGEAVVLALRDHQTSRQCVAELRRQRQPTLLIELGCEGSEEHPTPPARLLPSVRPLRLRPTRPP